MGILFASIAAFFTAFQNLHMRKSIDQGGTTKAYLTLQFFSALFLMILLNPVRTGEYSYNGPLCTLGLFAGVILGIMLLSLGIALQKGPPGLTFAALSSSTIMPAIVMATLFGAAFGHSYTFYHGIGSLLVLGGLFWAGKGLAGMQDLKKWVTFIGLAFLFHIIFLVIMQWRVLLITSPNLSPVFRLMTMSDAQSQWFMPMIYLGAFLFQLIVFAFGEKRLPSSAEVSYGLLGGLANGCSTFFLIQATEFASSFENAMIFPLFSVLIIVCCNLWGSYLYKEQVNWRATQLCMAGLVIGTVDWNAILKALGF